MITMNELVDLRMQQQIAHEIYRQQIMQRIPDPFPPMLPIPMPRHVIMPPRVTLPGVELTLQNDELWKQFHQIGTEMIITKSGRRMFPSMRLTVSGLEDDTNYCVLLEMVPIGDCRYKFSGSQWVPAGGAEPQSPQRMYLHPDSPASGTHWQAQPILFNKVKLTNNTLDNNGHIVLASMHKYQPRLHVIRTSDLAQIPWAPQQAFVFPETEFVAVTAYQNDRITKLKIDNNPFAKGFRETGQSRCKRKMSSSPSDEDQDHLQTTTATAHSQNDMSPRKSTQTTTSDSTSSINSEKANSTTLLGTTGTTDALDDGPQIKRLRSNGSACSLSSSLDETNINSGAGGGGVGGGNSADYAFTSSETSSSTGAAHSSILRQPQTAAYSSHGNGSGAGASVDAGFATNSFMHHFQHNMQTLLRPSLVDLACTYFGRPQPIYATQHMYMPQFSSTDTEGGGSSSVGSADILQLPNESTLAPLPLPVMTLPTCISAASHGQSALSVPVQEELDVVSEASSSSAFKFSKAEEYDIQSTQSPPLTPATLAQVPIPTPPKRKGFSISAILGGGS